MVKYWILVAVAKVSLGDYILTKLSLSTFVKMNWTKHQRDLRKS